MRSTGKAMLVLGSLMFALLCTPAAAVTADVNWMLSPSIKVSGKGRSYSAATKTLTLCRGDSANFHWAGGLNHDVVSISSGNWAACNIAGTRTVAPLGPSGKKVVKFATAGLKSYTCTVPGHCGSGQKVQIRIKSKC